MSPHPRCLGRAAVPAAWRVDWRSVPLLNLAATRTHAWLTALPLPRARNELDGMPAKPAALPGTAPGHSRVSRGRKACFLAQPPLTAGGWNLDTCVVQDRFWSRTRMAEIKQ
jgi:hypothetical protein